MKTIKTLGRKTTVLFLAAAFLSTALILSAGDEDELLNRANQVLQYLKNRDYKQLAKTVHTKKGITFSPYAYVYEGAVKFTAAQVKALKPANMFLWGYYDGSGNPMELNVEDYFNKFVFDHDFTTAPETGINRLVKTGNTNSNLDIIFPGASFVEYHFPGFEPKYEGMDWSSLRLVFEKSGKQWMLVAIVHDAWTI